MADYLFRRINTTTLLYVDSCNSYVVLSQSCDVPHNIGLSMRYTQFDTDLCVDGIYMPKQHIKTGIISRISLYGPLCI